jgi:PAS domain S-box-containing protein
MAGAIRVLYVDDEPDLLEFAKVYLEKGGGFEVDTLTSAKPALLKLNMEQYDAIISDYQMPEMDGISFLKQLKGSGNTTPFIIFTGKGREDVVIEALNEGADFYIQKGGEPKSQFAELSNKVRYAVTRRNVEEALRESEERLSTIFNAAQVGIIVVDAVSHVILQANPKVLGLIGASTDDITGVVCHKFICPAEQGKCPVTDLGQDVNASERVLITKNGERVPIIKTVVPAKIGNKAVLVESFIDISDRERAEEALRESEGRFRTLAGVALEGIMIHDHGVIIDCNPQFTELFGYRPDEIIGKNGFDFMLTPESRDEIHRWSMNGFSGTIEVTGIKKDGTEFYGETASTTILRQGKQFSIVQMLDITARKESEKVLQKKKDELDTAYEALRSAKAELQGHYNMLVKNEKELRESEETFRSLVQESSDGIVITDEQGVVIVWNEALTRITGIPGDEALGSLFVDVVISTMVPEHREPSRIERLRSIIHEQLESGSSSSFSSPVEAEIARRDGEHRYILQASFPIRSTKGFRLGSIVRDVTGRKRSEIALQESEERFRMLLLHVPSIAVQGYSMDGTTNYWNEASEKLYGYAAEEALGRNLVELIIPVEMRDEVRKAIEYMAKTGQPIPASELSLMKKDGSRVTVFSSHAIINRSQGRKELFCIDIDLTERKRAEEHLRESEEKYRRLTDNAQDMIYQMSLPDGIYNYISPAAVNITGYSPEDFYSDPGLVRKLIHPDWQEYFKNEWDLLLKGDMPTFYEYQIVDKAGKTRWLNQRNVLVKDQRGQPVAIEGIVTDITSRKHTEDALQQANKKLKLLSSITRHDINNQLALLRGYFSILEMEPHDPAQNEFFLKISDAAQRISEMVRFTKEYEQIGVNAPAWYDCHTIVDNAAKEVLLGDIILKNNIPAGTKIFADPLISKVCYNLLDNAVRYGGKITSIRFNISGSGDKHIITCEDDGVGVPANEKEKIFERGFGKNTGLGLALSQEILSITGITIQETGEPGRGARFEMKIPREAYRSATR